MTALEVWLHGTQVGLIEQLEHNGWEVHRMIFEDAWWRAPERPVLGQLFEGRAPTPITTNGPIAWFAHLLPQGPLLRAVAREAGVLDDDVLPLLAHLGADLVSTVLYPKVEPELALELGGDKAFERISAASFAGIAQASGHDLATMAGWVRETAQRAAETLSIDLGYTPEEVERLRLHQARTPLCSSS